MLLKVERLYKKFDKREVLKDISFEIKEGEVVAIIGPSGSGKSTLLRCLNMIETPTKGKIIYDNHNITGKNINLNKYRMNVGMVFQQFNLFPNYNVIENLTLVPKKLRIEEEKVILDKAKYYLKEINLEDKELSKISNLSGGEQQRVAIARALMMNPKILLFDEPTSSLDPQMTQDVLELIKKIKEEGMNIIIVSHELNFVKEISTRILFLKNGKIIFDGSNKEFFNSKEKEITDFLINTK